ncbi:MAG: hypothetical protein H0X02_01920 [Nitrosomonas sp.]|nr:hypothetical protein [Nitrosomonas sp.]
MLTAAHVFKLEHQLRKTYGLTPRQVAILAATVEAESFKEVADRCGIVAKSARVHMSRVYKLLGVHTKMGAYKKLEEIFQLCN